MRCNLGALAGLLAVLIGATTPVFADETREANLAIKWLDAVSPATPTVVQAANSTELSAPAGAVPMAKLVSPPKALPPVVQQLPLTLVLPQTQSAGSRAAKESQPIAKSFPSTKPAVAAEPASVLDTVKKAKPKAKPTSEITALLKQPALRTPLPVKQPALQQSAAKLALMQSAAVKNVNQPVATKPLAKPAAKPTVKPTAEQINQTAASQPAVVQPAVKQAVQTVSTPQPAKPQLARQAMTSTAGGRWQVKAAPGGDRSLVSMLADPFSNRRPAEWNALYRASLQPQKTQLIGVTQPAVNFAGVAGVTIVPASYASQGCGTGCSSCTAGACCGGDCGCNCNTGACTTGCAPTCCGPVWSFGVDAIFLSRDGPDMGNELVSCNCEENIFFAANGFDPDITAAPRFRLFRHQPCGPGLELTYFNLDSWNDTRHFAGDLNVFGADLGENSIAAASFDSQLQSLEVNLIRDHGCWTKLISGFRWVQVDEYSRVEGANATTLVSRGANTTNDLYGGHFGFRRLLYDYCGCLTVDSTVKAGVYGNRIHRQTRGFGTTNLSETGISFVGDVEFQANFEITCNCTFTAGYQLLWLTGLASAPEQFQALDYINKGETAFLHGANVGFVYTW